MFWKQVLYHLYLRLAAKVSTYQEYSLAKPFLKGEVLDIGCGQGGIAGFVRPDSYTGVDVVETQLVEARNLHPAHRFHLVDCTDRKQILAVVGKKQFDTVLLLTLLEFIPDPALLVRSCGGLLKDDGRLIITTPSSLIGKIHGYIYRHAGTPVEAASYFSRKSLRELLRTSYSIESFKSYNIGLSYFIVARPTTTKSGPRKCLWEMNS